ncbi:uncharacterized protein LOC131952726 [Physella acuta]|uniref:uncharacterized protein LOC131952726 n=1 Tax=Physella acuta TaxID=109671 RepID=UPI0027DE822E|nr:uncharacterized protein LOC131952726 [Physella acuta]
MTTKMGRIRRFVMRKRRCIMFLIFACLVIMVTSWISLIPSKSPTPVYILEKLTMKPVEPKFNVLEAPSMFKKEVNKIGQPGNASLVVIKPETSLTEKKVDISSTATITVRSLNLTNVLQKADNNSSEDIEAVKNKTISQLGVMGGKESENILQKIVFTKLKWDLTVSFEDIGNIMKDTSFLNKLKPLNLSGPMLTSTRNRTSNFSLSMPIKMGYCDCWERYCFCCVQLVNEKLHLNNKTCANFTFLSKTHELDISFSIDNKQVYSGTISADAPPLLCMGSIPAVADLCLHFFNMIYRVDRLGLHKSQILGCTDISLNIFNKTISVFPVDCFQIPGDPNHHHEKDNLILPNFVP